VAAPTGPASHFPISSNVLSCSHTAPC